MREYEYVSIRYEAKDILMVGSTEHREVIDDYAARGYRYIDSIITEVDNNARIRKIDLIFEKDA